MQSDYAKQGKTAAIVAYITIIGTLVAFYMNNEKKNAFASFHIRQALGLWIMYFLLGSLVSIFNSWNITYAFYIFLFTLWIFGFVTAIREEQKPAPLVGPLFQKWFTFIK
ncbi:hypothetical protein [Aquimarina sp. MMG016]|uniref:hypothetical protein n=1 Tax=Aquimarina sp. MMG016 TaxID=2822690 RepID=UPI001B3A7B6A|nr:hypothetical protein [Aquimarina sp. MMG016]MBQ4819085.1 hypothetical protein [Aquimarina sp. MMG016]